MSTETRQTATERRTHRPVRQGWRLEVVRAWRNAPWVASPAVLRWFSGGLFVCAGLLTLLTSHALELPGRYADAVAAAALAVALVGVAVMVLGRHLSRRTHAVLFLLLTVGIFAVALQGGRYPEVRSITVAGLLAPLLLVALGTVVLFPLRTTLVELALVGALGIFGLLASTAPSGAVALLVGSALAATTLTGLLARVAITAREDSLTRLVNRRGFEQHLEQSIVRAACDDTRLEVAVLDLDGLAGYNERAGEEAGDRLLVEAARRWTTAVPAGVQVARFGGDEFVVLMPDTPPGEAADLVDDLRALVPEGVTASAGVASWQHGDSASILLGRAEAALLEAKTSGRDRTVVFGDRERSASRVEAAIARGELRLLYQPLVDLRTGRRTGYEALIRWEHPARGVISPLAFIPQAEVTGAIHAIGRWVVEEVCRTVMESPEPRLPVSINVSVPELRNPGFARSVIDLMERWGMPGELLTIEVLERGFDDDDPQVLRTLEELRAHGYTVAMDDFGAGYSSLLRLQDLPIDVMKVDGALVMSIPEDRDDAPILAAVGTMGCALGVTLVAEHVETAHQAEVLRELGFDRGQGYLFSPPRPFDDQRAGAPVAG